MELKNLEDLIGPRIGREKKIIRIENSVSEQQGHGSIMLKLKVTIQNKDGKEESLHLVAKRIPDNEFTREMFNIQVTFKKEVQFYEVVLPILDEFQKEEGVDILDNFAKFYGARYSLSETSSVVDEDAIMLLEDLSARGFRIGVDKNIGFDLRTAEAILHDLAKFHGTVIALRHKKFDVFEKHVKSECSSFIFPVEPITIAVCKTLKEFIRSLPAYAHLADKAMNFMGKQHPKVQEPFGTIIHFDFWVNNIMNKVGDDEKVKNKFIDFQLYNYRSSVADVFFFLWTSVEVHVLEHKLDHLLDHYHQSLLNRLNSFDLDVTMFSYEKFNETIRFEAEYEFGHTLAFVFFLKYLWQQTLEEQNEFKFDVDDLTPEAKNFTHFMISECVKRQWL